VVRETGIRALSESAVDGSKRNEGGMWCDIDDAVQQVWHHGSVKHGMATRRLLQRPSFSATAATRRGFGSCLARWTCFGGHGGSG
jgi:hypothetical protein